MVALFKTLARMTIQKLADNPELRSKVASVLKEDIVPRAKEGWEQAKPELKKAREQLHQDWEKAKPKIEEAKRRARDIATKITK